MNIAKSRSTSSDFFAKNDIENFPKLKELLSREGIAPIVATLKVGCDEYIGELTVAYWWSENGQRFHCACYQYRMSGGENSYKNNLHFSFDDRNGAWWGVDSPDGLARDNKWHNYEAEGSVSSVGKKARIYLRITFDRSGWDPTVDTHLYVDF